MSQKDPSLQIKTDINQNVQLKLYESLYKIKAAFQSQQLLNVAPVLLAIK